MLSAINTLLLSASFKPNFIDFAHVLNMLALSVVFIFCVCVCVCVCVCFLFQVSSDLIVSSTHQEQYFYLKKLGSRHFTRHKTRHNSAIGILLGIKLGITWQSAFLLGIKLGNRHCTWHCARANNWHLAKSWFFMVTNYNYYLLTSLAS